MFIGNHLTGSLSQAKQIALIQSKNLKKLQIFCAQERLNAAAESYLFEHPEGLESFLAYYLQLYTVSKPLQQKLQQKKLLNLIKVYCDMHDDFCFSEPMAYGAFLEAFGVPLVFNVTPEAESVLFETENHSMLLVMAAKNRIFYRENKIRFLKLYHLYPAEVEKYFLQYCKDITLTEAEQVDVVKGNIRLIFRLKNVFQKTEALLFAPENKDVLLEYAAQRHFTYHDNEIKFLLLGQQCPTAIEKYLVQYDNDISLTEAEQVDVVKGNIRLVFRFKNVFLKTEALLFEPENKDVLLEFTSKERLNKITENYLFDYPEGQESFLAYYLQLYTVSRAIQQKLQQKRLLNLIKVYCDAHDDFCFSEPMAYGAFLEAFGVPLVFNVTTEAESVLFEPENKDVLLGYAAQRRFTYHDNEIKFLQLGKYYPDEVEKYLFQYGQNISLTENEQFGIVKNNIRLIIVLKNIFAKTETLLFEAGNEGYLLKYAAQRRFVHHDHELKFLLLGQQYPAEVEKYFLRYGKDITLTEAEQVDVVKRNIRLIFRLKDVFLKTEALLFEPKNKDALLEYAAQRRFKYHDNEIKFLQLGQYYLDEIEKYLIQYGQNISLTENEQYDVVKESLRLIFALKNIFAKTETLLFGSGNEGYLLKYAAQRRFVHHDHELKFLLLGQQYPAEVEQYLAQHNKDINLTKAELLDVLRLNKNGRDYLNVHNPVAYKEYVVPEKRRKGRPFTEKDLPMLIRMSWDNPLPLTQFMEEQGRFSPENEAELFFRAEEKCREKYISLYGVDLKNLVRNAANYGSTVYEQEVIDKSGILDLDESFVDTRNWKLFNNVETCKTLGDGTSWKSWCELCRKLVKKTESAKCDSNTCNNVYILKDQIRIIQVLQNIARRNYLLGAG